MLWTPHKGTRRSSDSRIMSKPLVCMLCFHKQMGHGSIEGNFVQPGSNPFPATFGNSSHKRPVSIEGFWRFVVIEIPSCIVLALAAHAFGPDNNRVKWQNFAHPAASWAIPMWLKDIKRSRESNHLYIFVNLWVMLYPFLSELPDPNRNPELMASHLAGLHESAITARHSSRSDWSCTKGPGCLNWPTCINGGSGCWFSIPKFPSAIPL